MIEYEKAPGLLRWYSYKNWVAVAISLFYGALLGLAIYYRESEDIRVFVGTPSHNGFSNIFRTGKILFAIPINSAFYGADTRMPLPYGTSVSEAILIVLTLDEILFSQGNQTLNIKPLKPAVIISLGLFAIGGLIANLRG